MVVNFIGLIIIGCPTCENVNKMSERIIIVWFSIILITNLRM